jgi:hypothetical protein
VKQRIPVMLGFKGFGSAAITIAGIELLHRIRKRQFALGPLGVQGPELHPQSWFALICSAVCDSVDVRLSNQLRHHYTVDEQRYTTNGDKGQAAGEHDIDRLARQIDATERTRTTHPACPFKAPICQSVMLVDRWSTRGKAE